jgi:hypothetical protein
MALKRINKELTDLGRYVVPPPKASPARLLARQPATAGRHGTSMAIWTRNAVFRERFADLLFAVTLPLRAQPAPLEMIWYVTLCVVSPRLGRFRRCREWETPRTIMLTP